MTSISDGSVCHDCGKYIPPGTQRAFYITPESVLVDICVSCWRAGMYIDPEEKKRQEEPVNKVVVL